LGLPFLIAQFGIEGFYQLWTFQQMVCNNQEPKGKEKKKHYWCYKNSIYIHSKWCWLFLLVDDRDILLVLFADRYKLAENNCTLFCSIFPNTLLAISHQFSTLYSNAWRKAG